MFQWRRDVKPGSGLNYGQKSYGHIYQIPDLHSLSTDGIQGRERERKEPNHPDDDLLLHKEREFLFNPLFGVC